MAKVTEQADKTQEQSLVTEPTKEDLMHLDDFLSHINSVENKIESIAAFGLLKKAEGSIKKSFDGWLKEFRDFENSTPE